MYNKKDMFYIRFGFSSPDIEAMEGSSGSGGEQGAKFFKTDPWVQGLQR